MCENPTPQPPKWALDDDVDPGLDPDSLSIEEEA